MSCLRIKMKRQDLICALFCTFQLVVLLAFVSAESDTEVIQDFMAGKRSLLSINLTPKRVVVVFGQGQSDLDPYVYEMPRSAFTPGGENMVTLSNGGPASEKWPALYGALKGKANIRKMVTLYDLEFEYCLVMLNSNASVLYNMDENKVEDKFILGFPLDSGAIMLSALQPRAFYSYSVAKSPFVAITHYSITGGNTIGSTSNQVKPTHYKLCTKKDKNKWTYADGGCGSGKEPGWTFAGGFTNKSHFHLVGRNVIVVPKNGPQPSSAAITILKVDHFFGAEVNSNAKNAFSKKHLLLYVIASIVALIIIIAIIGILVWCVVRKVRKRHHHHHESSSANVSHGHQADDQHSHHQNSHHQQQNHHQHQHSNKHSHSASKHHKPPRKFSISHRKSHNHNNSSNLKKNRGLSGTKHLETKHHHRVKSLHSRSSKHSKSTQHSKKHHHSKSIKYSVGNHSPSKKSNSKHLQQKSSSSHNKSHQKTMVKVVQPTVLGQMPADNHSKSVHSKHNSEVNHQDKPAKQGTSNHSTSNRHSKGHHHHSKSARSSAASCSSSKNTTKRHKPKSASTKSESSKRRGKSFHGSTTVQTTLCNVPATKHNGGGNGHSAHKKNTTKHSRSKSTSTKSVSSKSHGSVLKAQPTMYQTLKINVMESKVAIHRPVKKKHN